VKRSGFKRQRYPGFRPGAIKAKRPNKMNARRAFDPVHGAFDSGDEAEHFQQLLLRKAAGEIVSDIERQITYRLEVNGELVCRIRPDFRYTVKGATRPTIDEFKGFETDAWRIKWKLFTALFKGQYDFVVSKKKRPKL
jgi:hypothetical protein